MAVTSFSPRPRFARHLRSRVLEGRLTEEQLPNFRQEASGEGLSSYPHPWLMPDFWQFPDGVDGPRADYGDLPGALSSKYLHDRGIADTAPRKVWAFSATAKWMSRNRSAPSLWPAGRSSTI